MMGCVCGGGGGGFLQWLLLDILLIIFMGRWHILRGNKFRRIFFIVFRDRGHFPAFDNFWITLLLLEWAGGLFL